MAKNIGLIIVISIMVGASFASYLVEERDFKHEKIKSDKLRELRDSIQTLKKVIHFEEVTLDAIKMIESGNSFHKLGDSGKAFGCLQIHKCCVDEVNRNYKTNYTHEQMFQPKIAEEVFWKTMNTLLVNKYCDDWYELIMGWNGGYTKNKYTEIYAHKVQKLIIYKYNNHAEKS